MNFHLKFSLHGRQTLRHGLSKKVFSRSVLFFNLGSLESVEESPTVHQWLSPLLSSPQSSSIVPTEEVTDSPDEVCPTWICHGKWDRDVAARMGQEAELLLKAAS